MTTFDVRCQCGQPERARRMVDAPHTASCPIVLLQAFEETERLIAEYEAQVPMFESEDHTATINALRSRRDRLFTRLAPSSSERGTIDPEALWYQRPSKLNPGSTPRTPIGDQ